MESYIEKQYKNMINSLESDKQDYINNRVIEQIVWYDNKSILYKQSHYRIILAVAICTAIIPVITIVQIICNLALWNIVIGILGGASSVLTIIDKTKKYNELWIQYRSTCENLKHELHLYLNDTGHYKEKRESYKLFVETVETIMNEEVNNWKTYDFGKNY